MRRLAVLAAFAALAVPAQARTPAAGDARPNILVVMTDDMAAADLARLPNVQRLLVDRGTTFTDAVDSYPLCCPARATFITGQYAHNHGVGGNFHPYGWYGMADRANTLPSWLQDGGYRTAMVGKWLNGYGARDAHGEVPAGFDDWHALLDVSAYDYFNYVMNSNGRLRTWGDAEFARKLVEFGRIQVVDLENPGAGAVFGELERLFGPRPYTYFGAEEPEDYSVDVTGGIVEGLVEDAASSRQPFFIWWSPAASHREDVASTLMGRPGGDPRPPPRYADDVADLAMPLKPSFDEADLSDKPEALQEALPPLTDAQRHDLELDYRGRIGSLLAVDEHVGTLVATLRRTGQLDNTLIVFLSDNGWLQGEHRVPGDKYLAYEESLKVPFVLRGPGVPAGRTVSGQVANIDFAPTLLDAADARAGRRMDGISLLPVARRPRRLPVRAIGLEATARLLKGDFPLVFNGWDRPYKGVRTERFTYVVYTESGERELYDRRLDPHQLTNLADEPSYAAIRSRLQALTQRLHRCKGASCTVAVGARDATPRTRRAVHLEGRTRNVASDEPGSVEDRGTFTGAPFGAGRISVTGTFAGGALEATFRLRTDEGSVLGRARLPFTIADGEIDFRGTGRILGGTGAYRGITGRVRIHDHNTLDGQNGVVEVDGFVTY